MATHVLIENMLNPEVYPHPVSSISLLQTNISWIILTGKYVYKIKKPVDFEFLNYTALSQRKYFCEKELFLNKRLAPDIYLEVIPIYGDEKKPSLCNNDTPIIEYAIKMHEFSQENLFTTLADKNQLSNSIINDLAENIAHFHLNNEPAELDTPFGTSQHVYGPVEQNFSQMRAATTDSTLLHKIEENWQWVKKTYKEIKDLLDHRKENKHIKACHGDLHLGNIVLFQDKPLIFDCIEFNEDFRWIDPICDFAFTTMDLYHHGLEEYAHLLENRYFQVTGDYEGLKLLHFYSNYRAMVRAKIMLLGANQFPEKSPEHQEAIEATNRYLNLTQKFKPSKKPFLAMTHGLSGSGKSTICRELAKQTGAIHISSDIERKRLFQLDEFSNSSHKMKKILYGTRASQQTYQTLRDLANTIIHFGYSVIVDASYLKYEYRQDMIALAQNLHIPSIILDVQSDRNISARRIKHRVENQKDASEATLSVLDYQRGIIEPLTDPEKEIAVTLRAHQEASPALAKQSVHFIDKQLR